MKKVWINVYILTMNTQMESFPNGYLCIENDKIVSVGSMEEIPKFTGPVTMIDGKNMICMPGMINTHTHIGMVPFRSLGDDTPDRLRKILFPLEKEMTKELVFLSSLYGIAEMQLAGVTTFLDMYYFEEEVARATEIMKSRGFVGETVIDFPTCDSKVAHGGLRYGERLIEKWQDHDLITPGLAPHAPNTNSLEVLQKIQEVSRKTNAFKTIHVAEMDYEMEYFQKNYQMTPIEFLADIGFLDTQTILAHCIHMSQKDIKIVAESGAKIAHCIGANTKSAKGIALVKEFLHQGISVGLGTDGPSSGNTLDLFYQMRLFANMHKVHLKDRSAFPAKEIVRLATIGGAEVLGIEDKIGSLEVGKQADIVFIETESVNMFPIHDPYSVLVYSATSSNVQEVYIEGRQVVAEKKIIHSDLLQIRGDLHKEMNSFYQAAEKYLKI